MAAATPDSKKGGAARLPILHLLCNLGWNFLPTAQVLAMRGDTREVLLKARLVEVLQTRRYEYKGQWYPLSSSGIEQIVRELSAGLLPVTMRKWTCCVMPAGLTFSPLRPHPRRLPR